MRLEHKLILADRIEYQSLKESLKDEVEELKKIHRDLTYSNGVSNSEARLHIDKYNRIINSDGFKAMMAGKAEYYEECLDLINEISSIIKGGDYKGIAVAGAVNILSHDEGFILLYNKLERINAVLSDPGTTESQAEDALREYNNIINDDKNINIINGADSVTGEKAIKINNEIQAYLIKRDMITFGYFVDKMDNASKYAYNISVNYQRESMNKYVDFYKDVTKKLNTFGDYIKESINEGKQNKVYKREFYTNIYNTMKPYFYYGDGEGHVLYKNSIKLVRVDNDKFNVLIGDELIEKDISYEDAYKKMEYFFSCHEPVIKGTRICKLIKPIRDKDGTICGIEGKVEQFLFPDEFYYFMDVAYHGSELDKINDNFNKNSPKLSKWNNVSEESIAATSDTEYTKAALKKNYDAGIYSYYNNPGEMKVGSDLYQHDINSINQKIDGAKKGLQLTLDEYTQRYNTINSNYDNMLRTITTMISELAQEIKGFLRF